MVKKAFKTFVFILTLAAFLMFLVGCNTDSTVQKSKQSDIAKIGLGHITSIADSIGLVKNEDGTVIPPIAKVNTVIAVIGFDSRDRVVKATLDNVQSDVKFDEELQIVSDLAQKPKTKIELGDAYGLKKVSEIGKEWFEQINELENWMIGKDITEIKNLKVKQRDVGYPAVPDIPELTSMVTITVQDYLAVVEEAFKNVVEVPPGAVKMGLGTEISMGGSQGYSVTGDDLKILPKAQVDVTLAGGVFDENGKVLKALIDVIQATVDYNEQGQIMSDKISQIKSKKQLGDKYGMIKVSAINKEWYEQISELENWMVGKTVEEITALKVQERSSDYPAVPDVPELVSLVTVSVQDYLAAVDEAYEKSK